MARRRRRRRVGEEEEGKEEGRKGKRTGKEEERKRGGGRKRILANVSRQEGGRGTESREGERRKSVETPIPDLRQSWNSHSSFQALIGRKLISEQ